MATTSAHKTQDEKFSSLGFSKAIVNKEQVCSYSRALGTVSEKNPILVLIHGYPQSSYMWRHFIPLLPENAPIFTPDLPGYGASAAIEKHDKLTVGNAILSSLRTEVKRTSSNPPTGDIPIVLIGHDRGARVSHRLAVSGAEGFDIKGVCLIDIVPTSTQWQNLSSPSVAAKNITGYFHWPLLAHVDLATRMIKAFGPAEFLEEMLKGWSGTNATGQQVFRADDAPKVYSEFFAQDHVLKASCEDYQHGATTDIEVQEKDQEDGRKIGVPLFLLYSAGYIGSRYQFPDVWRDWVSEGVDIQHYGLGDNIGHFGAEEAPEESARVVGKWLEGLKA
ncbi:alpha/beta-hydrolase [Didymella exigua CBS 183.55]|uniref:Alpha/beta-hydrolase n=1 Tax=Didymella exigua CBS 183.55 TaxID=1150837 RepID=A0A6A5RF53_9PLEO|nr:alpha/beta-hydrolase [Didymella exigua CBS 183.55]KAF1925808.1 alpha/beta-hydrolase [Didymella exigua CBS 183.55]